LALPPPIHTGKVRDLYKVTGDAGEPLLLMVASDRVSAFDVVLPNVVPDKGKILTALSLWWFDQLADLAPNHVVTADVNAYPAALRDDSLRGRSMLVRPLDMVQVECVARAYLSGSGTVLYSQTGAVCGIPLPPGLVEGSKLPEPIFTPTTKGAVGEHDEPMTYAEVEADVGRELAAELRRLTLAVLARGNAVATERGILLADTKVEFGFDADGVLTLGDEVLTPDSSRFWPATSWAPGRAQPSYDKQPLRDWLAGVDWDRTAPGPELPDEVVEAMRARYVMAYELLTGLAWR
jgi:phosphoribosylaminoimidazole-succinocarboxamide synthase